MKQRTYCHIAILGLIFTIEPASGYELVTHGAVTKNVFEKTVQQDPQILSRLGIALSSDYISGEYFDTDGTSIYQRKANLFEGKIIEKELGEKPSSIKGWLMRGAIREDDVPVFFGDNPQDDPYGQIFRVRNHFYDPRNDRGLTVGISLGQKAPDWAIGAKDTFTNENKANTTRLNHFTVFDAREAMFRALTGMDKSGSKAIGVGGSTPGTPADKEAVRKAYWATTFRALGDLVHLIQDMAQPQHTRNDPHAGSDDYNTSSGPLGHKSYYEKYIDDRAKQGAATASNGSRTALKSLNYGNYPIPTFNDYVSYFSVQHKQSNVNLRTGLADYSNREFFTVGKNLGQGDYDLPSNSIASYTPQRVVVDSQGDKVDVLYGSVHDAFSGVTEDNVPLTTWGLWNEPLKMFNSNGRERFTLIRENYDAMANRLIPRAVAYSAGLINHFFRGRLEIKPPVAGIYALLDHAVTNQANDGFSTVKLRLRNATPDINDGKNTYPQDMTNGSLYAVAKFRRNTCYQPDLSGEVGATGKPINGCSTTPNPSEAEEIAVSVPVTSASLSRTVTTELTFDFSQNPIPVEATDLYLQVVYRGPLGSENDAVVVSTVDLYEPTFFAIANSSDFKFENNILTPVNDVAVDSFAISNVQIGFSDVPGYMTGLAALPVRNFVRLAVLTDANPFIVNFIADTPSGRTVDNASIWNARIAQHAADGSFSPSPLNYLVDVSRSTDYRGTNWNNLFAFYASTIGPSASTDFSPMDGVPFATNPLPLDFDIFNPAKTQ